MQEPLISTHQVVPPPEALIEDACAARDFLNPTISIIARAAISGEVLAVLDADQTTTVHDLETRIKSQVPKFANLSLKLCLNTRTLRRCWKLCELNLPTAPIVTVVICGTQQIELEQPYWQPDVRPGAHSTRPFIAKILWSMAAISACLCVIAFQRQDLPRADFLTPLAWAGALVSIVASLFAVALSQKTNYLMMLVPAWLCTVPAAMLIATAMVRGVEWLDHEGGNSNAVLWCASLLALLPTMLCTIVAIALKACQLTRRRRAIVPEMAKMLV